MRPGDGLARAVLTVDLVDTGSSDGPSIVFRGYRQRSGGAYGGGHLARWEPEALLTALRGWGLDDLVFIVGNGDEVVAVRPPFPMGEEWGEWWSSQGRLSPIRISCRRWPDPLHGDRGQAVEVRGWLNWSLVPSPPLQGSPLDHVSLVAGPNELMMTVDQQVMTVNPGWGSLWVSTDGLAWRQADTFAQQGDDHTLEAPSDPDRLDREAGTGGGSGSPRMAWTGSASICRQTMADFSTVSFLDQVALTSAARGGVR